MTRAVLEVGAEVRRCGGAEVFGASAARNGDSVARDDKTAPPHRRTAARRFFPHRRTSARLFFTTIALLAVSACRQDMHDQPKYQPYERNPFFADQRASRALVPGVVARGHLDEDEGFFTGTAADGAPLAANPLPITRDLLLHGRQRYDIYCSPCHDRVGAGEGMIVLRGYKQPPTFHDDRLRSVPDGYLFQVITNGFATMPSYAPQVGARDRWAIIAYLRALQLSQHASVDDVPASERAVLGATP